ECKDQLAEVKRAGCKQVQGHLFSKAMPASEIAGRVLKSRSKIVGLDHILEPKTEADYANRKIG
ncbi:hypothetical protein, partial [Parasphingorhabdus sp.]|uniref:hypothetical protein n=1 Tax=Parasphingorhabdus sp. TaxID=2709688 RepID=UPI00305EA28D